MNSPFSRFPENDLEICKGDEWVIRVSVNVTDLFQNKAENGCLDIQLGMRLPRSHRIVGSCMATRTAAWSLAMDRSPRFSNT